VITIRRTLAAWTVLAAVTAITVLAAGTAMAVSGPSWQIEPIIAPSYVAPGGAADYEVLAKNVGTGSAGGLTISYRLPAGLSVRAVHFWWSVNETVDFSGFCTVSGQEVVCSIPQAFIEFFGGFRAGQSVRMEVEANVAASLPEGPAAGEAVVQGGGAQASVSVPSTVTTHPQFGFTKLTLEPTERTEETPLGEEHGHQFFEFDNEPYQRSFTQAGGHPWALTTTGEFTSEMLELSNSSGTVVTHDPKDIVVDLPPGLLGDPLAVPRCPLSQVTSGKFCPVDTQIGVYRFRFLGDHEYLAPIVDVVPEAGQSAEFALETTASTVPLLTAHLVRTTQGGVESYGFVVVSKSIPQVSLMRFELTFWGVPADPSHDAMRGRVCRNGGEGSGIDILTCEGGSQRAGVTPVPFLTMPSDCVDGGESGLVRADSWEEPGRVSAGGQYAGYVQQQVKLPAPSGCGLLGFGAGTGLVLEPDTDLADAPVGLGVGLKIPLDEEPGGVAAPLVRSTRVTLPEGMSVSPGVVDGIQACNATGPEGINITGPESEFAGVDGEWHLAPGKCPDASIVGTAEAITPYLPVPVKGHVYLARPGCGNSTFGQRECTVEDARDGNLYKLYLELGGSGELADTGIEFKVPLETEVDPATGQITAVARELVQAPYSEVKIRLNGGPRAPLASPPTCGTATSSADLAPWSAPGNTPEGGLVAGSADSVSSSVFEFKGCTEPVPFAPGFSAGTATANAGKYSAFTMNITREDREQYVKGIQVHTPPGLLATLASVPLCPETQANNPAVYGECAGSKIGTARVASGAGSHPFEIEGSVYLTGPYKGAPFGLSIVTHVVAGPFNLGLNVVRARIDIDPTDSTATITTDETGPYAVPQIIFGVPVRLKRITVNIDRPGFMFNPTSCNAEQVTAKISGSQEAVASISSPFAAGECQSLAFKPSFEVATSGHTSHENGANLDVKLSYPAGSLGSEANLAEVKVSLPKQLPSRLGTLQKACPAATFAANPALCPAPSVVGVVKATTPLLPVQLSGPAYFVSNGGEAFPNLVVVLQGDGVRVDLVGDTFISRQGITSSTFKTVPDVPVGTFELYLPEGHYSALAANTNLCTAAQTGTRTVRRKVTVRVHGHKTVRTVTKRVGGGGLVMPTEFKAQNGAVVKQNTTITVTGCNAKANAARASRARTAHARRAGGHNR
jgi:hypothetical protein